MELPTRTDFSLACESFRRLTLRGLLLATIVSVSISFSLFLWAGRFFHQVFRVEVGGKLGDGLMGLTLGLTALSPLLLFCVWSRHRAKRLGLRCHKCRNLFTTQNIARVRASGKCPACGTLQFYDVDLSHSVAIVDSTAQAREQDFLHAYSFGGFLVGIGALFIFNGVVIGVQWIVAGIVMIMAGVCWIRRRFRFRKQQSLKTVAEQSVQPEPRAARF
jgi:uncharacterized membrane protein